jgi:hypothetical protein
VIGDVLRTREELPHNFLRHTFLVGHIATANPSQHVAVGNLAWHRPDIDGDFHPRRHRDRSHPPVLAAATSDRRSPQPSRMASIVRFAQPLLGGYVPGVQELLGLLAEDP